MLPRGETSAHGDDAIFAGVANAGAQGSAKAGHGWTLLAATTVAGVRSGRLELMESTDGALRAGVGVVQFPLEIGVPMMGYGARTGRAEGVHDPLHARALYLSADSDLLIVACDLCLMGPGQAAELRVRLANETGLPVERITVSCIHTHSGPDTGLMEFLSGQALPGHVPPTLDAIVAAGVEAVRSAAPARLSVGHGTARIGRNRRREGGPVDEDVLVLRLDQLDGEPLALAYTHGCHPTALGHENLQYSADWVGAANREIAEALPGVTPIFWLSAHSDIDPRTRGLLDLAIPGQSLGVGFDEVERLGREVGSAAISAFRGASEVPSPQVGAASATLRIPAHAENEEERREALEALALPPDATPSTGELFAMEHERTADLPLDEKRERLARVRRYLRGRTARHFVGGPEPEVEAQVLRVGPVWLLALPAEPTVDVGAAWLERMGSDAVVLSIANGWLRYLPHPQNFEEPNAHHSYEVLMSTLVPDAAERLLAQGERLAAELSS
jgi:hypothetical protein